MLGGLVGAADAAGIGALVADLGPPHMWPAET
jgi:hypothetical protein